jgi:acetate---CoA ligase (ADP-forming)
MLEIISLQSLLSIIYGKRPPWQTHLMKPIRPLYLPPSYQDAPDHGRLILRDGSTASIRLSRPEDVEKVRAFHARLSPQSRRMRFFSEAKPGEDVLAGLCDSSDPQNGMTLLVWRSAGAAEPRIIATGSYLAAAPHTAEFAVAVDDAFQGKGLGGLLLERLSVLAASHGFTRFSAFTDARNHAMLETFRHSGFQLREQFEDGLVEVVFSVEPGEASAAHARQRDRLFTKASLRPFFQPQSVAVIGASRDPARLGHRIFMTILRRHFYGVVYPVNPLARQVSGVKAYPTAEDLPEPVDLAIIAVPRDEVLTVIDQCARRGVRAVIILSTGFAEADDTGKQLQQELVERVRGYGMRMLGPNCLGLINNDYQTGLNASMAVDVPPPGNIAISSQSGALGMALLKLAQSRRLGISAFVSMGNKADVTGNDLLYYWEDDPAAQVILLYLESFGNPRRFGRIAREVGRRKPVICVKSGRHADPGEESVLRALFQQSGVIRMKTIEEMFDVAALLSSQPLPAGPRTIIITNSRGAGLLCRSSAESSGINIAELMEISTETDTTRYREALTAASADASMHALILIDIPVTPRAQTIFHELADAITTANKPVLLVTMHGDASSSIMTIGGQPFPAYLFPETAARALAAALRYRTWRDAPAGVIPDFEDTDFSAAHAILKHGELSEEDAAHLLACAGIRSQPVTTPAIEVDIEVHQHPFFGPVLSFSLAGLHRDVLHDVACRMVPLTDRDARELLHGIRARPLLESSGADLDALTELILRVSLLAEEVPGITRLHLASIALDRGNVSHHIGKSLIHVSEST